MKNINHFNKYIKLLEETSKNINLIKIEKIYQIILKTIIKERFIYIGGNGGSASVSNHMLCDFNKNIKISSNYRLKPKVISLSNSNEIITAIGNDINFNKIFLSQIENYAKKDDCVILLSVSGTSKNIIEVLKFSKKKNLKSILLTGFSKNNIKNATVHLNLNCKNYGVSEDLFSSILHMITQKIRLDYSKKKINYL